MPPAVAAAHERRRLRAVLAGARHAPPDPGPHAAEPQEALCEDALLPAGEADHRRPARPAAVVSGRPARSRLAVVSHERFLARAARPRGVLEAGAVIGSGRGSEERDRTGLGARQDAPPPRGAAQLTPARPRQSAASKTCITPDLRRAGRPGRGPRRAARLPGPRSSHARSGRTAR